MRTEYDKGFEAGRLAGKRDPIETVLVPWASNSNGFWNGDMFEDWLKSDDKNDPDYEIKKFLRQRDAMIVRQTIKDVKNKLGTL